MSLDGSQASNELVIEAAKEVAEAQRQYERDNTHITYLMAAIRSLRRALGWA